MSAPAEFQSMGLDVTKFKSAGVSEWRGPCPRCGGTDRFRVHTDRPFPHWYCVCREGTGCNWRGWADQLNPALREPLTEEQKRIWGAQRAEAEAAQARYRARKLAEFTDADLIAELHNRMGERQREWWRSQGVPDDWQDYLRLGYRPSYTLTTNAGEWTTPAYTIPYFSVGFKFVTMQYRLENSPNPNDRYRFEKGLATTFYNTLPDQPLKDEVIICEGAKKSIVTTKHTTDNFSVLAIPSKAGEYGIVEAVKDCGAVYVLLDPDGEQQSRKLAAKIGAAARVVSIPEKVDDAILLYGLTDDDLKGYLRQGVKV